MTDKSILMDPKAAIAANMDPMGNRYRIHASKQYPGLYTISYTEARSDKMLPDEVRGHWTNVDRATLSLNAYLVTMWEKVEAHNKPLSNAGKARKEPEGAAAA